MERVLTGMITADKITIDGGAGTIGGLTNTAWDAENITSGQAATEDQLKTVSDSAIKYDVDSGGTIIKIKSRWKAAMAPRSAM